VLVASSPRVQARSTTKFKAVCLFAASLEPIVLRLASDVKLLATEEKEWGRFGRPEMPADEE
jgi:hypothetical protein